MKKWTTAPIFDASERRGSFQLTPSEERGDEGRLENEGDRQKLINRHAALHSVVDANKFKMRVWLINLRSHSSLSECVCVFPNLLLSAYLPPISPSCPSFNPSLSYVHLLFNYFADVLIQGGAYANSGISESSSANTVGGFDTALYTRRLAPQINERRRPNKKPRRD